MKEDIFKKRKKKTGTAKKITSAQFIYSDRKNKNKSYRTKYNYYVRGLKKAKFKMEFDKEYALNFKFQGNMVTLYNGKKKILTGTFPHDNMDGCIAFATMHIKAEIDDVKVTDAKNKVIFEDNFDNPKTLWVPGVRVKITSKKKKNTHKKKKQ